jgi:cytochrome c556
VLDAKPAVLRAFAQQLATSMDQIITSTQKKDAARLTEASGQLDQICEQCHLQFWYPNQKPTN